MERSGRNSTFQRPGVEGASEGGGKGSSWTWSQSKAAANPIKGPLLYDYPTSGTTVGMILKRVPLTIKNHSEYSNRRACVRALRMALTRIERSK